MATAFDEHYAESFRQLLIDFGEPIVYVRAGAPKRAITAIVDRSPGEVYAGAGVVSYNIRVKVLDDAVEGIAESELNEGDDVIELKTRTGNPALSDLVIDQVLNSQGGVLVLKVA